MVGSSKIIISVSIARIEAIATNFLILPLIEAVIVIDVAGVFIVQFSTPVGSGVFFAVV